MASQGPNNPGTLANDASFGLIPWANVANAASSNDLRANANGLDTNTTQYLKVTNFGFTIPDGAKIDGIVVEAEVSKSGLGAITDVRCRLVKGGTIQGTDRLNGTGWTTTDTYLSHGGAADLWGGTWAASDINNAGFGCVLAAQNSGANPTNALCDHIRITVYYTVGGHTYSQTQVI